LVPSSNG